VEYHDRDPENGNYIVKRVSDGEVLNVPSMSAIAILKLSPGQKLVLFQPDAESQGYLLAPM
jgi:hypothetical protein